MPTLYILYLLCLLLEPFLRLDHRWSFNNYLFSACESQVPIILDNILFFFKNDCFALYLQKS